MKLIHFHKEKNYSNFYWLAPFQSMYGQTSNMFKSTVPLTPNYWPSPEISFNFGLISDRWKLSTNLLGR